MPEQPIASRFNHSDDGLTGNSANIGVAHVARCCCRNVAVAVMSLCKQVGRFDRIDTAVIATLDAETAKTQLTFSMLMVAGLVAGHWLV